MKIFSLLLILLILPLTHAALPNEYVSGGGKTCNSYCWDAGITCDYACIDADYGDCTPTETNRECSQRWMDAAWRCKVGCANAYEGCKKSCRNLENLGVNPKSYDNIESQQKCEKPEESGCCAGYQKTEHNVCCRIGFSSKIANKEIACVADANNETLKDIQVKASKKNVDFIDELIITFKFVYENKNPDGLPYPGRLVAESPDDKNIEFKITPKSSTMDQNGELQAILKINSQTTDSQKVTVHIYNTEMPSKKATVNIFLPKISITSFKKLKPEQVWQDSWSTYQIDVNDPYNSDKDYYIKSNEGVLKVEEIEQGQNAVVSTKNNQLNFGWKAPKITQEMRINYGTKITMFMIDQAQAQGTKAMGDKWKKVLQNEKDKLGTLKRLQEYTGQDTKQVTDALADLELLSTIEEMNDNAGKLKGFFDSAEKIVNTSDDEETDATYDTAKNLIEAGALIEGFVSNYGAKTPISFLLAGTKEFFALTDEMKEIARAKKISNTYYLDVTVKSKKGVDSTTIPVEVEGFEMILAEENYIPFK
jgi:hypothetical protein